MTFDELPRSLPSGLHDPLLDELCLDFSTGLVVSAIAGEGREASDEFLKGDSREECDRDREANRYGCQGGPASMAPCNEVCQPFRPPWLDPRY